ncbi:hypothetical protein E2562_026447 [Oryza meyeriana var. granulata]|uniref:Uncharacterized protein n=1 Tax=Oryza meyeriana var. granulata TaxID=110450 RepID=A0A6G1FD27_9ORYZ|nr:hypothetical protein E2562_026447 [Oryza meyeriana var. granulata]
MARLPKDALMTAAIAATRRGGNGMDLDGFLARSWGDEGHGSNGMLQRADDDLPWHRWRQWVAGEGTGQIWHPLGLDPVALRQRMWNYCVGRGVHGSEVVPTASKKGGSSLMARSSALWVSGAAAARREDNRLLQYQRRPRWLDLA